MDNWGPTSIDSPKSEAENPTTLPLTSDLTLPLHVTF